MGHKSGADGEQATVRRLYLEAAHWLETKFRPEGKPLRPCLTVHVGAACPLSESGQSCVSPAMGDVYIPKWDEAASALVAQATVVTGLLQLVTRQEIKQMSATLLAQDMKDFIDVMADAKSRGQNESYNRLHLGYNPGMLCGINKSANRLFEEEVSNEEIREDVLFETESSESDGWITCNRFWRTTAPVVCG